MNVFSKYYMNFTFNLNLTLGWKFSFVWFLIVKCWTKSRSKMTSNVYTNSCWLGRHSFVRWTSYYSESVMDSTRSRTDRQVPFAASTRSMRFTIISRSCSSTVESNIINDKMCCHFLWGGVNLLKSLNNVSSMSTLSLRALFIWRIVFETIFCLQLRTYDITFSFMYRLKWNK